MDALMSMLESDRGAPEMIGAGLIAHIGGCRMVDQYRRNMAQKRKGERPWSREADEACTESVDPGLFMIIQETLDKLSDELPVAGRELLKLIADGWSAPDAAEHIGWSVRKAQRFMKKFRAREFPG